MWKNKVISSLVFKFIERLAVKAIGLVISIVLARLLAPEAFGLIAIVSVFINLAQNFVTSGLGTALVQNQTTKEEDYSTVFCLSLGIAGVMVVILYAIAPLIAAYYETELLIWPLRVLSLPLLFSALHSVQTAKLQKELRFKTMLYCNLASTVISGTVGIAAAVMGAGIWALVIYNLMSSVVVTVLTHFAGKWKPVFSFSLSRAKVFWGFGWKLLISGLLCSIYNDVRSLIIGKRYSTEDLAYYNRGQQFPDIIAGTLDISIQSVMLPVMSSEQDSQEKLNKLLLLTMSMSMFVICPVMLGLAAVAKTLIPLLLTSAWNASIPYMVLICLANLTFPVMMANLSAIKAMGRSDVYMRTEIVRRIVMTVILVGTIVAFDSVMAIAISYVISSFVDVYIIAEVVRKHTGITKMQQVQTIWKTLLAGFVMAIVVYLCGFWDIGGFSKLLLQVTSGAFVYFIMVFLMKEKAINYLISCIKHKQI